MKRYFYLALSVSLILSLLLVGQQIASATSGTIYRECGTLRNSWGPYRYTTALYVASSGDTYAVYLNPNRAGYHKLEMSQLYFASSANTGLSVTMAWSNNNGVTWNIWKTVDLSNGGLRTETIYAGSSNIRFRFVFSNKSTINANQARYRIFCAGG